MATHAHHDPFDPMRPLVPLAPGDDWRLKDAYEGTQIFGATGSGKTSGSGAAIARAFLRAEMGGLVCCAKPDERATWEQYARETGRSDDLRIVAPGQPCAFNFLDYELRRTGAGAGQTENLVNLLSMVTEIAEGKVEAGGGRDPFWDRAMRQMLRNAIDLISLAGQRLSLDAISDVIGSAPQTAEEIGSPAWSKASTCAKLIQAVFDKHKAGQLTPRQQHDYQVVERYWLHTFATLSDRTRSGIVITFTAVADLLSHGLAWELLANELQAVPDAAQAGFIFILDLPIQEYGEAGRVIQGIWKTMFQRAMLRRDTRQHPRPVFLWCDESQNFISSYDYEFQAVARSARACTVYLTQNLSNYHARLGSNGHAAALSLLGNFQTKIWHANGDHVTNQHAADTLGQKWIELEGTNWSGGRGGISAGGGANWQFHYKMPPADFARLRKGGPENGLKVDGVVFQGGRVFEATGDTHVIVPFMQQ